MRFDLAAKGDETAPEATSRLMLQSLLAERFRLLVHNEERSEPVYLLQVGSRGIKLQGSLAESTERAGCISSSPMTCHKVTMATLARALRAHTTGIDVPVVDETGLKGTYDFTLSYEITAAGDVSAPTIFDAIQEQLGLKLRASKRPVKVLVIDDAQPLNEKQ
jgi:uncharacterized protein (TIGR03435 family)